MDAIILAGGKAERFSNKLIQATRVNDYFGQALVCNSVHYALKRCGNVAVMVGGKDDVVRWTIERTFQNDGLGRIAFLEDGQKGLINAIKTGADACLHRHIMILHGDNVYPDNELKKYLSSLSDHKNYITTRFVQDHHPMVAELDTVRLKAPKGQKIRERSKYGGVGGFMLSSPWILTKDTILGFDEKMSLIDNLNSIDFDFMELSSDGWWDLGSGEVVKRYWRGE